MYYIESPLIRCVMPRALLAIIAGQLWAEATLPQSAAAPPVVVDVSGIKPLQQTDSHSNDLGERYSAVNVSVPNYCASPPAGAVPAVTCNFSQASDVSEVAPLLLGDNEPEPPPPWRPLEKTPPECSCESCRTDSQVLPAAHVVEGPTLLPSDVDPSEENSTAVNAFSEPHRLLLKASGTDGGRSLNAVENTSHRGPMMRLPKLSLHPSVATVAAMSVVIGLFLLSVLLIRRSGPKSATILPDNVVCVLGRKQLAARQFAQLLRVGSKLLLVSVTPDGTEPLTELTDPAEIDRIVGLCQAGDPHSSTAAFEQVLDGLSREHTPSGFLGSDAPVVPASHNAGSYLGNLGGYRHA